MGSKKVPPLKTRAEFEETLRSLEGVEQSIDQIGAELAEDTRYLREKLGEKEAAVEAQVKRREEERKLLMGQLFVYFEGHRGELLEGDRRSVDVNHARVGLRLASKPAVIIDDEEKVLAELQRRRLDRFIRNNPTVNRDAMREDQEAAGRVPGVSFEQGEMFFVEFLERQLRLIKLARSVKREPWEGETRKKPKKTA